MSFTQQAFKGKNDWPYYLLVVLMVLFGWQFIGVIPLLMLAFANISDISQLMEEAQSNFANIGIDKNLYLSAVLFTFVTALMMLLLGVKYVHKRSVTSLVTSRKKIDWKRFLTGFSLLFSVIVITTLLDVYFSPEDYTWNFKPVPFITLVLVTFLLMPLQTSFEELFFRSYIIQGLSSWCKNRWLPLFFTSITFGLLHFANPEVAKLGSVMMIFYIGAGFFFGIVTLMDEGSEIALGLHAANNIASALFVTTNWTVFQTDALFVDTTEPIVGVEMFASLIVMYPLIIVFLAKKYKWNNWKERLFGKI